VEPKRARDIAYSSAAHELSVAIVRKGGYAKIVPERPLQISSSKGRPTVSKTSD
jgi:hypothetical protein